MNEFDDVFVFYPFTHDICDTYKLWIKLGQLW